MKKLMMTVALLIGMIATTFANEKEVKLTLDDNKLHYNYYSPYSFKGIVVDKSSKLTLKTEDGFTLTFDANDKIGSQKGHTSESISVSFDLTECQTELLNEKKVVEVKLQHANGIEYYTLTD